MLTDLYVPGDTSIHRAGPGWKLLTLAFICSALFVFPTWPFLVAVSVATLAGYRLAHIPPNAAWQSVKPALWVLVAIFAVQLYFADALMGLFVTLRLAVMILAASLVTMTTRSSEMIEGITKGLSRAPAWVPTHQIALSIALALRFIPIVRQVLAEVREAQAARGMGRNWRALLVPLIVRLLKTADEMALAIDARTPE